jgi:hypothetical protein
LRRFLLFKKRQCFSRAAFLQKITRDFGQKKRRASYGEEARRPFRFFCPKSPTGTAEGASSQPSVLAPPSAARLWDS